MNKRWQDMTDEEQRAIAAEMVRESRARQGLPPKVTDPEALRRLAVLITSQKPTEPARRTRGVPA